MASWLTGLGEEVLTADFGVFWWWKHLILTRFVIYITSVNIPHRAALTSLRQSAALAKILTHAVNVTKPEEVKAGSIPLLYRGEMG